MRFLRPAAGYGGTDQGSNEAVRHELNILDVSEETNQHQQNYYGPIFRMGTDRISWKLFDYHPKGRRERG
jgi:hypothetical protein